VDTVAHLQLPAKIAAEAQSQSGHDMYRSAGADPFLYENLHTNVDDLVDKLGKQMGGWYPFCAQMCQTASGWKAVPWFWVSFPATYNMAHFKKAGFGDSYPKTWAELLSMGKVLKKQGNPVGIPISHCSDAHSTYWSVSWSYGAKVLEADGKTPAINSDKTAQVIEWYKELFKDAMEPEVLSWDDAGNNRFILSGKGSWIHNPVSPYNAALKEKMPIADDINHHNSPAGPAGAHSAPPALSMAIWKFSKNQELAREFIQYLFKKENYDAWIVASNAFNHPPCGRSGPRTPSSRCCPRRRSSPIRADGRPSPPTPCSASTTTTSLPTWWRRRSTACRPSGPWSGRRSRWSAPSRGS
jgi:multiple sugar transport system substrate-binding protein